MSDFRYINLTYLETMSMGDPATKSELLKITIDELQLEIPKMMRLHEQADWEALKDTSHRMKNTLPFVGHPAMTLATEKINTCLKNEEDKSIIPHLLQTLQQYFPLVLKELQQAYARSTQ